MGTAEPVDGSRRSSAPVAGIDSARLNPPSQQAEPAVGITTADGLRVIESPYGHGDFLIEMEQVAALVRELSRADPPAPMSPRAANTAGGRS